MDTLALTTRQRRSLERQLRTARDARLYRRTLAVLEVAGGEPVPSVAARLRVTPRSVYLWVAAYDRDRDPDSLTDRDRTGRPPLLAPPDRHLIRELLAGSPQELGYPATEWTVPLLREHLMREVGRGISGDTLRREIRGLGFTWKRSRYVLDPDPEAGGKNAADQAPHPTFAGPQRRPGGGRD